jgi:hypothetical protein
LLKLANDHAAAIHSVLFGGISHHRSKTRHRKNKQQLLHRVFLLSPIAYRNGCIRTQLHAGEASLLAT